MPRTRSYDLSPTRFRSYVRDVMVSLSGAAIPVTDLKSKVRDKMEKEFPGDFSTPRFYTCIRQFDKTGEITKDMKFEFDPTGSKYDQYEIKHVSIPKNVFIKRKTYYHL